MTDSAQKRTESPIQDQAPILWHPSRDRIEQSGLMDFARMARDQFGAPEIFPDIDYRPLHQWSVDQPERFWAAFWKWADIGAENGPKEGLDSLAHAGWEGAFSPSNRPCWFPEVRLNFAENLLRKASILPDGALALISWDESGRRGQMTFQELRSQVITFANRLESAGIQPGDRVAGYLPNIPETVVAFLGCAAMGAIWSSCSPDFGVHAVVDRFAQIEPRLLLAATGYRYKGKVHDLEDRVSEIAAALPSVTSVILIPWQHPAATEATTPFLPRVRHASVIAWGQWMAEGDEVKLGTNVDPSADFPFPRFPFDHPLVILYSSGTTGLPKCIVHGAGGTLLQHRKEHTLHVDLKAGDRFFYFTTCGWMMWNWLVSGLAQGATLVLYDGAPALPEAPDILWRLAEAEAISVMGVSARYLALMEKSALAPGKDWDLRTLQTLLSTGSPLAPSSFDWVYAEVKADVHLASISGGTDIVSCFVGGVPTIPVRRGEIQGPGLGMAVEIRASEDPEAPLGRRILGIPGELVCTRPFPSMPTAFWNDPDHQRFTRAYFAREPGLWCHGDWAEETPSGGYRIHGRSDATLNPGGVRIGTAELYRQVEVFPEILEAVAVGRERPGGGPGDVEIALFVRLQDGVTLTPELDRRLREQIRTHASPHHVPRFIQAVPDLPRTVSGKLSELAVRERIHGRPVQNMDALANPEALDYLEILRPTSAAALLSGAVDYAGLFPPSALSMADAVANFAEYRIGKDAWALGRFVVPATQLRNFYSAVSPWLTSATPASPWELSVLLGTDLAQDLSEIRWLEEKTAGRAQTRSVEGRVTEPAQVSTVVSACRTLDEAGKPPLEIWLELPLLSLPEATDPTNEDALTEALRPFFAAIQATGVGGKVRTGSVDPDLFPTPEALLVVLKLAASYGVAFKATAGLHHPLRGRYPLTYEKDAPLGWMFGYLNVLLATLALREGKPEAAQRLLVLADPHALIFEDDALLWAEHRFPLSAIRALRSTGMTSFGSCSLREPVDELSLLLHAAPPSS
jgi:acetoacetyl-CoA synthetase